MRSSNTRLDSRIGSDPYQVLEEKRKEIPFWMPNYCLELFGILFKFKRCVETGQKPVLHLSIIVNQEHSSLISNNHETVGDAQIATGSNMDHQKINETAFYLTLSICLSLSFSLSLSLSLSLSDRCNIFLIKELFFFSKPIISLLFSCVCVRVCQHFSPFGIKLNINFV